MCFIKNTHTHKKKTIIKPNQFQVDCHLNGNCHDLALKRQGLEANVTAAPGNKLHQEIRNLIVPQ